MPNREAQKLLRKHRHNIGESAHAYRARRLTRFRSRIAGKKAVYLDINYWIELEKIQSGGTSGKPFGELLALLLAKVEEGRIFCPISAGLLMEVAKQEDPRSRTATGRLMDRLCKGIGLTADDDLVALEVASLLLSTLKERDPSAPSSDVWAPVGCVAADPIPEIPLNVTAQKRQQIEKAFFDSLLDAGVESLSTHRIPHNKLTWDELAKTLNAEIAAHENEVTRFNDLVTTELIGAVNASRPLIARAVSALQHHLGSLAELSASDSTWPALVASILARNAQARAAVPSLYIRAGLHALLRWNKGQKFKPNDTFDFSHAAGALGYCDVFLTEGPLRNMLGRGPLKLSDASSCLVVSGPQEAIRVVAAL